MIVDAAREGAGDIAGDIAAILTERGLGGDDPDLRIGSTISGAIARGRARGCAAHGGEMGGVMRRSDIASSSEGEQLSVGAILALAYPDRVAKNRGGGSGQFLLANGRGAAIDPASALAREPFIVVAEHDRHRRAEPHPAGRADHAGGDRAALRDEIESRDEVTFDPASASLRATQGAQARRDRALRAAVAVEPDEDTARILADGVVEARASTVCPGPKRCCNGATA